MSPAATEAASDVRPEVVWSVINGYPAYWALASAVDLDVFDALAAGPSPAVDLADRLGADAGKLAVLLDALTALGLLARGDAGYALTSTARELLVPTGPRYLGALVRATLGPADNWAQLTATVRSGHVPAPVGAEFYRDLVAATFPLQYAGARALAPRLVGDGAHQVLDLGAGAAPWAIALLEAAPGAQATVNDLDDVLPLARRKAGEHGVADRCRFVAGDYHDIALAEASYDVVVLGHVCRAEGVRRAPALVARAVSWLRPGGTLLVVDYFPDDGPAAVSTALLSLVTAANTPEGRCLPASTYRDWMLTAGTDDPVLVEPAPRVQAMVARRRG